MNSYTVELASWIIQDGNYADFQRGETRAFAIEFSGFGLLVPCSPPVDRRLTARLADDDLYEVTGRIVHWTPQWQCLDIGVVAYCDAPPTQGLQQGQWVNGWVGLGVDPFFYAESFSRQADAPPLIHDWVIEEIHVRVAPFIEVAPRTMAPDPTRTRWQAIERTNAWTDQGGQALYRLRCRLLDHPPRWSP